MSYRCMLMICQGETHRTPLQLVLRLEVDRCIVAGRCERGRRRRATVPCHRRRRRINLAFQSRMPAVLDGIVGPARAKQIASAGYSRRQRRPRRRRQHLSVIRTAESRHTCRAIASRCVTICCRTERAPAMVQGGVDHQLLSSDERSRHNNATSPHLRKDAVFLRIKGPSPELRAQLIEPPARRRS